MQIFWWGHQEKATKIYWTIWERLRHSKAQGGMGFRGLVCFNKTLLAKQCSRLVQHHDSLKARIIKAKYYPRSSIPEAALCKSIQWVCDLLKQGLIWRIENRKIVKISKDKWLPTPTTVSIQSPRRIFAANAKVIELIDHDTKWLNTELIRAIFIEDEVGIICKLPFSYHNHPNAFDLEGAHNRRIHCMHCISYRERMTVLAARRWVQ